MQLLYTLLVSAATLASAQTIDPNSVSASTRAAWCLSQQSQCPLLCTQINDGSAATYSNTCDPDDLTFSCVCGNNLSPNSTEYSQTVPFFECQEFQNQCVAACNGNIPCSAACRDNHPCGATDPKRYNITSTSSTASATGKATGVNSLAAATDLPASINGNNGAGNGQTHSGGSVDDKSAGMALAADMGKMYGTVVVLGSVFLGFAVLL